MNHLSDKITERTETVRRRLREGVNWFPFPALLSFVLILLFIELIANLNPRYGNLSRPLEFPPESDQTKGIWFSLMQDKDRYIIRFDSKETLIIGSDEFSVEALKPLKEFIKSRISGSSLTASLHGSLDPDNLLVKISVDEKINYGQFKPILYILSELNISNYGFEVKRSAGHG